MPAPTRYMLTSRFRELTIMPAGDLDMIETLEAGWTQKQIDLVGAWINTRLAKRYAVPFGADPLVGHTERDDVPEVIEGWIVALMTLRAFVKRGFNPSTSDDWFVEGVINPAKEAKAEVLEAADSEKGLFDLPFKASEDPDGTGVTRGGPLGYSEASPYAWTDVQLETGRNEDANGRGTRR